MRQAHMQTDLLSSHFTHDLYRQYHKHLGALRFFILKQVQQMLVPGRVRKLLGLKRFAVLRPALWGYKLLRTFKLEHFFKNALLPLQYKSQIHALDVAE